MGATLRDRMYLIRAAIGGGLAAPASYEELADRMNAAAGSPGGYTKQKLSNIANGGRRMLLEDAVILAAVDPARRGLAWLAEGESTPTPARPLPPEVTPLGPETLRPAADVLRERATARSRPRGGASGEGRG